MYYLKGINYQSKITAVSRAVDFTEQAYRAFEELLNKFPNSIYKEDSLKRLNNIKNTLVANDLIIGKYYLSNGNYIGAMNHFKNSIAKFGNSRYTAESLYRLVEIHDIFGLKPDALQYYSIMNQKYKNSIWTTNALKIISKYEKN
jgi:outer membrane protein assembly factor BamD